MGFTGGHMTSHNQGLSLNGKEGRETLETRLVDQGELETVMQTQDALEGLHNFWEFSPTPECLDEAM